MNQNYEVIFEKYVEDLKSKAFLLKHKKSGARIFILSNDDDNKVFYIGFRTPPEDNTGVAHIMEHSVLCGSKKYPLKDPFVELVKGSLNTFLNAMTYPDKTVYPVASRNDKDFKNLMDVYMDAVLNPNIYTHPEIMKQEGWNYKLENKEDEITYNGVVYNEMKGAFSSPEGVLEREILHSLYPDTSYGVESGGDPEYIPELTYENFIGFHKRYYHPENSFIYLYGDMDIEERLEFLDKEYLSKYEKIDIDSQIKIQKPFNEIAKSSIEYPISEEESEKENTYLTYNIVCGNNLDSKQYYAMQMILYALIDTQGAPIRDRLFKEGIGKDFICAYENGIAQPYFNIIAKNAEADQEDRFIEIINEEFEKAACEGLDEKSLIASVNSLEFKYKEADFGGYPKGLIWGLNCLDSWLYDENEPLMHIDCNDTFKFLRENIKSGYFEELIKKYLLNNNHASIFSLVPKKGLAAKSEEKVAKKLKEYKQSLSDEEIEKIIQETKALSAYQEEPETKEALETIPLLSKDDLKRQAEEFKNEEKNIEDIPVYYHEYDTNGIAYISLLLDSNMISPEDAPYLSLLKSIFSFVDTKNYSYAQLNNEINIYTGALAFDCGVYSDKSDDKKYSLLSDVSTRTLYENIDKSIDLIEEIVLESNYEDTDRLYEIIVELKSKLQMSLNQAGHVASVLRSTSYFSEVSYLKEIVNGIEFYKFIEELDKNYESRKVELKNKIKEIVNNIFNTEGLAISFTGDDKGYEIFESRMQKFATKLKEKNKKEKNNTPILERKYLYNLKEKLVQKNEGFKTSAKIQYVAKSGLLFDDPSKYTGALRVFKVIMSYEYMWFNIRVQGGAYGCMCAVAPNGIASFVTYRDPHLKRSIEVFDGISLFLENFDVSDREMTKFIIGTMSSMDSPLTPCAKGQRDMMALITHTTYEDVQKARDEVIDCKQEDIKALAQMIQNALDGGNICVIGNETKIEESKELFKETKNLFAS